MTNAPEFVILIRQLIPRGGLETSHPSRVKSRIKKLLIKNGYTPETIRGIGQKIGDYVIVYGDENNKITASIQRYDQLTIKPKKTRNKAKGRSQLLTGIHHSVADMTVQEFAESVAEQLPAHWERESEDAYRWVSVDMALLMNTQYHIESASRHIEWLAETLLLHLDGKIHYTLCKIDYEDNYLIGIGPV